jgi:hypothetical protein
VNEENTLPKPTDSTFKLLEGDDVIYYPGPSRGMLTGKVTIVGWKRYYVIETSGVKQRHEYIKRVARVTRNGVIVAENMDVLSRERGAR